jgi:hypothetical protein
MLLFTRIGPALRIIDALLGVVAREEARKVLGVLEILADDSRGVSVGQHILPEPLVVAQDVVDQRAEEGNVGPGADRREDIGGGRGACEARVHVDDRRATLARLHHEAEADRMALGHVRPLNQDAVRVHEIPLRGRRAAASQACSQTGNRGTVSDTGLVGDMDDT